MKINTIMLLNKLAHMSLAVFLSSGGTVVAQLPSTDIFLMDMKTVSEWNYVFSDPVNITNREGYDNQPAFSPQGQVYYTARMDSSSTDIFMYDPVTGKNKQITHTSESEYSPTFIPGSKSLSVVRVDKDSAQRLYQMNMEGKAIKHILPDQDSVGYHCWMDHQNVAMFILGDTATLRIASISDGRAETIARQIGRCIAIIPGTNQISFIEKQSSSDWFIKAWNPETNKTSFLMKTPEGSEDYAWTPDKKLIIGKDGRLLMSDPFKGVEWKEIASFVHTIGPFYRIAISKDGKKVALVSFKGLKP